MRKIVAAVVLLTASLSSAGEPGFQIVAEKCTTVLGHISEPSKGLEITDASPRSYDCTREDVRNVSCIVSDATNQKSDGEAKTMRFTVMEDSQLRLILLRDNGADKISVRPDLGTAAITDRLVNAKFAGATVCVGSYSSK